MRKKSVFLLTVIMMSLVVCGCSCKAQNNSNLSASVFTEGGNVVYMSNCFLKLDGIEGDCTIATYDKWINVLDFELGVKYSTTGGTDDWVQPLVFVHFVDKATPSIQANVYGRRNLSATLTYCTSIGGKLVETYSVVLSEIRISSAVVSVDANGRLVETVTLVPGKYTVSVTPVSAAGVIGNKITEEIRP